MPRRHPKEIEPPYRDPLFMESLPARPVRITTEYIDPLERMRREKVGDTIVIFGSARILSRDRATAHLKKLQKARTKRLDVAQYRIALRTAKSAVEIVVPKRDHITTPSPISTAAATNVPIAPRLLIHFPTPRPRMLNRVSRASKVREAVEAKILLSARP